MLLTLLIFYNRTSEFKCTQRHELNNILCFYNIELSLKQEHVQSLKQEHVQSF